MLGKKKENFSIFVENFLLLVYSKDIRNYYIDICWIWGIL